MNTQAPDQRTRLQALLASGAISPQDYHRLLGALDSSGADAGSPTGSTPEAATTPTPGTAARQASLAPASPLSVAAAAGSGALAGTLAANIIERAMATPAPQIVEAEYESTTVWTEDGYVTESQITWEDADGDVVAEEHFSEEVVFDDDETDQWDDGEAEALDGGEMDEDFGDFDGFDL